VNALYFSHIPKTAGTSLRKGAVKCWGKQKVLFDYGDSVATSDLVKSLLYDQQDLYSLKQSMLTNKIRFFSAHKPAREFYPIFPAHNIFTFVRDPVERGISHYRFFCQHFQYKKTLAEFSSDPQFSNLQAQFFDGIPAELFGFIGIQERFDESLQLFNKTYNCKFPSLNLNRHKTNDNKKSIDDIDNCTRDLIKRHNQQDIRLYELAENLFNQRMVAHNRNLPYVYGRVQSITTAAVLGWACAAETKSPTCVDVYVNEKHVATVSASEFRPQLKQRNANREGFVGFSYKFKTPIRTGDRVSCRSAESGQILGGAHQTVGPTASAPAIAPS